MKSLSKKMIKVSKELLKFSALYVFLCDDVSASQLPIETGQKLIDMLVRKEMISLILLAVVILAALVRMYSKKLFKNKKKELDNLNIQVPEKRDSIQKEEFRKLEEKYDELRNQRNLKEELRKDNAEDFDKTRLLSRIELDITLDQLAKLNEKKQVEQVAEEVEPIENLEVSKVEVLDNENSISEIDDDKVTLKDINEELRQEREDLDAEKITDEEIKEAEEFYSVRKIGKNVKNVIDKSMELKKRQILDIALCINSNLVGAENYKTVINTFVDEYIEAKYRRQCEHQCKNSKTLKKLVNNELDKVRIKLIKNINRSYSDKYVNMVFNMFLLINSMDNIDGNNLEKIILECDNLDIIDKNILIKKLSKIHKTYYNIYFDYYNKLTVDKFELIHNKKIDTGGLFEVGDFDVTNVSSSIQFSKIFSDYIIDKTYNSDVILEDIREVQLKLISFCVLDDLLRFNHRRKYVINFPDTIFKKERKVRNVLNAIGDGYSQNKVFILVDLETVKSSKNEILKLRKDGFKFIVQVNAEGMKLYDGIKDGLSVADYLVYVGPRLSKSIMKDYVPSYLLKKIIYTDKSLLEGVVIK
ncbi:MAG: hypothetical protein ACI4WW_01160 [Candidatus Coprovivens sp.]